MSTTNELIIFKTKILEQFPTTNGLLVLPHGDDLEVVTQSDGTPRLVYTCRLPTHEKEYDLGVMTLPDAVTLITSHAKP